jgi:hypothetical protein
MNTNFAFYPLLILILLSGTVKKEKPSISKYCNQELRLPKGIFKQEGYGFILEIKKKYVDIYEEAGAYCYPSKSISIEEFMQSSEVQSFDEGVLTIEKGITLYTYQELNALPDGCNSYDTGKENQLYNFNVLVASLKDHYAFFDSLFPNFESEVEKVRPRLKDDMSEEDFFKVVYQLLKKFNDGHTEIEIPEKLSKKLPELDEDDEMSALRKKVRKDFLEKYVDEINEYNKGVIRWGNINDNVLYVQINGMDLTADYGINQDLNRNKFFKKYLAQAERDYSYAESLTNGVATLFNSILENNKAQSIILDIRINNGGYDGVGLEILRFFAKERTKVLSKKARIGNGFSAEQEIYIEPSNRTFDVKVYVLTSCQTVSAAEIMAMGAKALPNAKLVGAKTQGTLSDALEKQLPNGWNYTLSNEVYLDSKSKSYEGIGIPPDHQINYPSEGKELLKHLLEDLKNGDEAIDNILSGVF